VILTKIINTKYDGSINKLACLLKNTGAFGNAPYVKFILALRRAGFISRRNSERRVYSKILGTGGNADLKIMTRFLLHQEFRDSSSRGCAAIAFGSE
jgi:hypothetical protein